jgi:hypothetical protein
MSGCETRSMSEKLSNTWERRILWKVYGPVIKQGVWRTRTNQELRELYESPDLVADIKGRMLKGLGHMIKMDQTKVGK